MEPNSFSIGVTLPNTALSPPTIIDKTPASAPLTPPLTGASSIFAFTELSLFAISRVTEGDMVLISITILPS